MRVLEGNFLGENIKVGLVVARFNDFITSRLLDGAIDTLKRHGVKDENIDVAWTPGAFEIPLIANKMAESTKYHVIITLGAVIRGATPHFDYVSAEVTKGVSSVGLNTGVPVIFGVLTTDTIEQAIERAGTKAGNKGSEAAMSALEIVNLLKEI